MKILAICETTDFENFTRRTTFEAIAKISRNLDALCHTSIKNIGKVNLKSKYVKVSCYFRFIPERLFTKYRVFEILHTIILKAFLQKYFSRYDIIVFSSPRQYYFLPLCKEKKIVFLISDPYHLLGDSYEHEKLLINNADIILTTSSALKDIYLKKYFRHNKDNVYYWPNTVDIEIWDHDKVKNYKIRNEKVKIGFIGDFIDITDIDLLDHITDHFRDYEFHLAGRVRIKENNRLECLKKILMKKNVVYLGQYTYNKLPEIVIQWDAGIILDSKSEISSYRHHNKLYQYLALGKPVIAQKTQNDYDIFSDAVFLSDSKDDFVKNIMKAIEKKDDNKYIQRCLEISKNNCSIVRAGQFLEIMEKKEYAG